MVERLILGAAALLVGVLFAGASTGALAGTETGPVPAGPAEIELRKSFRSVRRSGRQGPRPERPSRPGGDRGIPDEPGRSLPPGLEAVAAALGEQLQSSGTLHLPDVDGGEIVLEGSITPILQAATGRRLIIDRDRTIDPGVSDRLSRRWPDFTVVQPPAGADFRDVVGSLLDAAGYDSVLRSAPLIFGRNVSIRVTPDFLVLRSGDDLLSGETRAISVLDPVDALPPELRELAGEYRVRIVDLTPDGSPAGPDHPSWRDPSGRVTTVETARLSQIIEEIAVAFGLSTERRVPLPDSVGDQGIRADLSVSRDGVVALVFEKAAPHSREPPPGDPAIMLNSADDLPAGIGALLRRFNLPAIGPVVEFYRETTPGATRRFVIRAEGWLTESGGRRLLITGASVPPLVRLFLTREGVDIFEYRIRDGR